MCGGEPLSLSLSLPLPLQFAELFGRRARDNADGARAGKPLRRGEKTTIGPRQSEKPGRRLYKRGTESERVITALLRRVPFSPD